MPTGFPTAPAVQTITDKLATIAPELGNVPGYYVYLKDPIAGTIYESATATDGAGNWSITGVTMGLTYQYSYGKHPATAYPFQGAYVASNPPNSQTATAFGGALLDYGGWAWNIKHALFGAKGGAQMVSDGAMTNGSAHVTSASGLFVAGDVGKSISVSYAKSATIGPGSGGSGTITAFNSATDVTVSFTCTNAGNPTGSEVTWGYDDTVAIRAAITKVQTQGRGAVLIPGDTFIVCPQTSLDTIALPMTASNVEIMGLGPKHSRLWFRCYQMQDPKSNWTNNGGLVLRGNGIQLISQSTVTPLSNVTFRDFEFDGDAGYTGNPVFPANISTGDGWDITMKGICYFNTGGVKYDNIKFLNVHSHSWRGENLYAGGDVGTLGTAWVFDCELNDTNGDGLAFSSALTAKRNHIYKHAANGVDDAIVGSHEITDNYIHDCDVDGIQVYTATAGATGPVYIENNRLANCKRAGIHCDSAYNTWIRYNKLIDCGWFANNLGSISCGQTTNWASSNIKGLHVTDNEMWANAQNLYHGVLFSPGATSADDIEMDRNFVGSTSLGIAAGKTFNDPYFNSGGVTPTNARIRGFYGQFTSFQYTDQAYAYERLLTTTSATVVVKQRPYIQGLFRIEVYFRVITGATNVTITANWTDATGAQSKAILTITSEAVGSYQMAPLIVASTSASDISVTVTAGTANQVYVSASITEGF